VKNNQVRINIGKSFFIFFFVLTSMKVSFGMNNLLLKASRENDMQHVRFLLKSDYWKKCVKSLNARGETPLYFACYNNNWAMAQLFLNNGAAETINVPGHNHETPLHCACNCESVAMIKLLFEHGARDSLYIVSDFGKTPLIIACQKNNMDLLKILFKNGAQATINQNEEVSKNGLFYACNNNNLEMVKLLLMYGAEVSAEIIRQTNNATIQEYLHLVAKYERSRNKLQFIIQQQKRGKESNARFLTRRLFLQSIEQIMHGGKSIESTLFAKMYAKHDKTFLKEALAATVSPRRNDVWKYVTRVMKKKFCISQQDIKRYDNYEVLRDMGLQPDREESASLFSSEILENDSSASNITANDIKMINPNFYVSIPLIINVGDTTRNKNMKYHGQVSRKRFVARKQKASHARRRKNKNNSTGRSMLGKRKIVKRLKPRKKQRRENNFDQ